MLLALVLAVGLVFRPSKRIAGTGIESLVLVLLSLARVGELVAIALAAPAGSVMSLVRSWAAGPAGGSEPLPVVVEFLGHDGRQGLFGERGPARRSHWEWLVAFLRTGN